MGAIIEQLGLDRTFFYQLIIFFLVFMVLSRVYFRPFLKLFSARHQRTVADREAAEKMMAQAEAKLEEYKRLLAEERSAAKRDFDAIISDAKKEEARLLGQAREEAKKIAQEANESVIAQRDQLRKQLEADVESIAKSISDSLLSRKV